MGWRYLVAAGDTVTLFHPLTGRFNICMVPGLRPLGVSFMSCGESHTAVLTKVHGLPPELRGP